MSLLNKYRKERLLEKRLSRLENLILERSMLEAVKPNIFSKNINAVKAAVDAGEKVNQTDSKGRTPLICLAASKSQQLGEVASYLLDHGANILAYYNNMNAYELACKYHNESVMEAMLKSDAIKNIADPFDYLVKYKMYTDPNGDLVALAAAADSQTYKYSDHLELYMAMESNCITRSQYEEFITDWIENTPRVPATIRGEAVTKELENDITASMEAFAKKFNILFCENNYTHIASSISEDTAETILSLYKQAAAGKLKIYGALSIFNINLNVLCKKTGESTDFLGDLYTPAFIKSMLSDDQDKLFYRALSGGNKNLLQNIVDAKISRDGSDIISSIIAYVNHKNKEITRLALRLLDKSYELKNIDFIRIARCGNEYLISYFVDKGYGEDLALQDRISEECNKVLADNDIDIQQTKDHYKRNIDKEYAKISRNNLIKDIVDKITHDTWGRYYDQVTTEDPSLLLDDRVVKAIEDSEKEGGAIARQLRRRLDAIRSSMPKDLYDM